MWHAMVEPLCSGTSRRKNVALSLKRVLLFWCDRQNNLSRFIHACILKTTVRTCEEYLLTWNADVLWTKNQNFFKAYFYGVKSGSASCERKTRLYIWRKIWRKKNCSVFHFSPSSLPVLHLHFHFRPLAFTTDLNVMCWGLSPLASGTWLTFGDGWWWFFLFFKLQYCFSFSWSWFAALTCCLTAESTLMRHKWKSLNSNLNS